MKRGSRAPPALAALALSAVLAPIAPPTAAQGTGGSTVQRERGQGLEVRFVAYPWRPDIFAAFEAGGSSTPASWAFARLVFQVPFLLAGRRLGPGHYAMVLVPRTGTLPMALELRRVDGREFFTDPAVMSPPPPGETLYKAPAAFVPGDEPSPVLGLTVASFGGQGAVLTIRYGDRKLALELARTEP